ncbi:hypothetical protein [Microbacterium sp. JZ31]|uniref:hypothetical protein n=1 Tax=Microbacterium sp. JZ31 TaxID=1906274 RepID=UPI001934A833|nr:hypothetical protein [Microbacterium sp. JZ31]
MDIHESSPEQPHGEAARLDHEDADRLATEHGETDFAGFSDAGDEGSGGPATASEQAALDEAGLSGDDEGDDRVRPRPS